MSRRKPAPESALPGKRKVRIVCSDRGQHTEVSFGAVAVWPNEAEAWRVEKEPRLRTEAYVDLDEPQLIGRQQDRLHRTYALRCKRCGRNVPLRLDTLETAVRALAAMDTLKLDISRLV